MAENVHNKFVETGTEIGVMSVSPVDRLHSGGYFDKQEDLLEDEFRADAEENQR